jgi:SAM-dependent methyltransferase
MTIDSEHAGSPDTNAALWERHAGWWQEHFTDGADPEYEEQILPLVERFTSGAARVCEVGCGEGQVARRVAAAGAKLVVGLDGSVVQIAEAAARAGGPVYLRGDAGLLPLPSGSMDAVVVCLVFEHLDDIDTPVAEVARVLAPGGRFVLLLNHPLLQTPGSGWVDDHLVDPPEQYWQLGNYLEPAAVVEEVSKGVFIRFVHRPLGIYLNCLADAGLVLEHVEEPAPPPGFLAAAPEYPLASHIPRLMTLVLRKT